MSLKEIFCQEKAIGILQKAFASGKTAHAYIFAGPQGVGKFKTAREWSKLLLCQNPQKENGFADSCGSCESCSAFGGFEAGSHPDFNPIYKELIQFTIDGKDKKNPVDLPIDVIREFLIEKVSTRPTLSQRKVFVVSEAERLNASSQNALMKVLEEPPVYCSIFLLCTRLEKLLPTTKSRCQIIRFGPIDKDRIIEKLQQMGIEQKQAEFWARLAQGSIGDACKWARLELAGANLYKTKKKMLESLTSYSYSDAIKQGEWLLSESRKLAAVWAELDKDTSKTDLNRKAQKTIVQIIIAALHDAMKLHLEGTQKLINFDQQDKLKLLAGHFNIEQSAGKISDCYRTIRQIESSVNEKLIFEQLLLKLADLDIMIGQH